MQTAYKDLDIQFLPNNILQELSQKGNLDLTMTSQINSTNLSFSTEVLSNENLLPSNLILDFLNNHFHNLVSF